jgi:outer membrane protein assembly factor BamB
MLSRSVAAIGLLLCITALCQSQNSRVYSRAVPPDKTALNRLNLKTEWSLYLPVDGRRDSIELIQTFDDQMFVQTKTGLLIAIDVQTGRVQWSAALGNGGYSNVYPVAVNSTFVFVTNVTTLYAFYRYTGVTEFTMGLGTVPTAGLAADDSGLYAVLASRPGSSGTQRLAAFNIPRPIVIPNLANRSDVKTGEQGERLLHPVKDLTDRYPGPAAYRPRYDEEFARSRRASLHEVPVGGLSGSRTPSLAVMPKVTAPYTMEGGPFSPSLAAIPSLRQPYHLRDDANRYLQRTPSISSIPPSVAAALMLGDLRPRGVSPPLRWEYGLDSRVLFTPVQSPLRLWLATDNRSFLALSKIDKQIVVTGPLWEQIAARPGQAETLAYVPLVDGTLVAVDLEGGNQTAGVNSPWRVNIGGLMNRTPLVTEDAVFVAGDNTGVARVDRKSGTLIWRTERAADRIAAVNEEFAYVRDRHGRLLVYDANRATAGTGRSAPLTGINVAEFNVPVVNTVSDRVYLAADNGLIVCLRDASPKYAAPVRMTVDATINPPAGDMVRGFGNQPGMAMPPEKGMMPPKKIE